MNERQILASPNWYNSFISDISLDGIFAYGGKNTIFLLNLSGSECCQFSGQLCGHKDRVTSVQFCKTTTYSRCCVSASEDLSVIVWDIDAKEPISSHSKHQARVTAVSWSQASHDWIYSGDEKGHIVSWDHKNNRVYEHVPLPVQINCISCPPDEEGVVAVGYKNGQIIVLMLQKGKQEVVNILKGHNEEIHSLVWSPVSASELSQEIFGVPKWQESGHILASGSRDKTIRFWNILLGQFTVVINIPTRSYKGKQSRDDYNMTFRLWNTICWPQTDPNCLISSGFHGDILSWNLSKNTKQKWELFNESKHSRIIFNICHYPERDVIVSVSMDRQILIWNRGDATISDSLSSCGGFVYSLDFSVLDPSCLAVGVGDNAIRIWNTASPGLSNGVTNTWRGIGTKVMKVLWHPVKEGLLSFGTEEGKVGLYNVLLQTCSISRIYHKKSVYSLSWGPPSGSSDEKSDKTWHLYSCGGEGIVLEHNPDRLHDEARNIDELIKKTNGIKHILPTHTEVCCKPDRSLMAVGNEDGSVVFYCFPDLKLLSTMNIHKRNITCLTWYRTNNPNDSGSTFLASGSNGCDVHVHDLKHFLNGDNNSDQKVIRSSYRWLSGHSARVTNVVWSPHSFSKLASSSYDGTVQVWDVLKGEPLVNFRGHSGRVMAVTWSLLDPDVLFSGSDDFTVRSWRISQQVFKSPPTDVKKHVKPKFMKKKKKTASVGQTVPLSDEKETVEPNVVHKEEATVKQDEMSDDLKQPVNPRINANLPDETSLQVDNYSTEKNDGIVGVPKEILVSGKGGSCHTISKGSVIDSKKKRKKGKSMFPLSASADNKTRSITSQDCVDIATFLANNTGCSEDVVPISRENINLALYADRASAFTLLTEEGIHHAESGNIDYQLQLEIWKGNIGKALELAVEKKQLSDWLVSLSHLAGEHVRLTVTEIFAEQLVSQENFHRAALYYLACHQEYKAINMFQTAGMYREAIALAKVRLLPSDPLLLDLYSSWGRRLESEHFHEQASKCYLACGLHDDAIRVLTRRADEMGLHSAAQVAKLCRKSDLSQSLVLQCALIATRKAKWNDATRKIDDYPDMQPLRMFMIVHENILTSLLKSGTVASDDFPEIQDSNIRPNNMLSNPPPFVSRLKDQHKTRSSCSKLNLGSTPVDSYFVCEILERWWFNCNLHTLEKTSFHGLYVQISTLRSSEVFSKKDDIGNVLMIVSMNICLALATVLLVTNIKNKNEICIDHLLQAITDCHNFRYPKLVCHLVQLLFPFRRESWEMIEALCESNTTSRTSLYFDSIMAFYYHAMLTEFLTHGNIKTKLELGNHNIGNDGGECSSENTLKHDKQVLNIKDPFNSCNGGANLENPKPIQSTGYSPESGNDQSVAKTEFDFNITKNDEGEENVSGKLKEIYQVCLDAFTILLSDSYAQFQKMNSNMCDAEHVQDRQISLSIIPFPNVLESTGMLTDSLNCIIESKKISKEDKEMAKELSHKVSVWVSSLKYEQNKDKCL